MLEKTDSFSTSRLEKYLLFILFLTFSFMIIFRAKSAIVSAKDFYQTLEPIFQHPFATREEKLKMKWPASFEYVEFIQENTPEHSIIWLPKAKNYKEKAWLVTKNNNAYALFYPRKILPFKKNQTPVKKESSPTYYLSTGEKLPEEIQINKAWVLQNEGFRETNPDNLTGQKIYGVFQL